MEFSFLIIKGTAKPVKTQVSFLVWFWRLEIGPKSETDYDDAIISAWTDKTMHVFFLKDADSTQDVKDAFHLHFRKCRIQ